MTFTSRKSILLVRNPTAGRRRRGLVDEVMRLVRAEMLEVLRTDYIKFARARGLSNRVIHFKHALKNTLLPVLTITGLQLGGLIAFAIITETVFQWPGIGSYAFDAIVRSDYAGVMGFTVYAGAVFMLVNLLVDITHEIIDPRGGTA